MTDQPTPQTFLNVMRSYVPPVNLLDNDTPGWYTDEEVEAAAMLIYGTFLQQESGTPFSFVDETLEPYVSIFSRLVYMYLDSSSLATANTEKGKMNVESEEPT